MISWFRTYQSKIGTMPALLDLSREAATHLESTYGIKVEVYTQLGGDPMRIGLLGRYNDLAGVDTLNQKIASDSKWADIMSRGADLAVEGSIEDAWWQQMA